MSSDNKNKSSLSRFYFQDPYIKWPQSVRKSIKTVSFLVWGAIFLLGAFTFLLGLNAGLNSSPPLFALFTSLKPVFSSFWLGLLILIYFSHHLWRRSRPKKYLGEIKKEKLKEGNLNIAPYFHPETKKILASSLTKARKENAPFQLCLFIGLLEHEEGKELIEHFGIEKEKLKSKIDERIKTLKNKEGFDEDPKKILQNFTRQAFSEAVDLNSKAVRTPHLFITLTHQAPDYIEDIFLSEDIEMEDAKNVTQWLRMEDKVSFKKSPQRKIKHKTMNRAWTAKPTKFLDQYSRDLTDLARAGLIGNLVGHKREVQSLLNVLTQKTSNNCLLVGEAGSGRNTIIEHLAHRVARFQVPGDLKDQRVVSLDVGSILAGVEAAGDLQKRLQKIMDEITASKNIVLAIPKIHNLIKAAQNQEVSFMSFFGPIFQGVEFPIIATTDSKNYHDYIEENSDLAGQFTQVNVEEISTQEAIKLILIKSLRYEKQENVTISYYAAKEAVELADQYINNRLLPGSAIDLLKQSIGQAQSEGRRVVKIEDVRKTISTQTGIPVDEISTEEAQDLLNLEDKIHNRLIDQEPAVKAVAKTLRQARTGVGRKGGPTGTFLFDGPTGVGKTELAKTLSEYYFGSEERMLRFDMSEYQTQDSIYQLIGSKNKGGFLTEAVKDNPFSLILLDEFEKSHPEVLNIFLQIFEDGRITDERGQTVDFSETIIICTSNAHSRLIQEQVKTGKATDKIQEEVENKLTEVFKPELVNRFDDVIVFTPLKKEEIYKIAKRKLIEFFEELEQDKNFRLSATKEAIEKISELGYDPQFGARPIRRVLRDKIRSLVARKILEEKLEKGKKYAIDYQNSEFIIKKKSAKEADSLIGDR